jgi:hypothetical protein
MDTWWLVGKEGMDFRMSFDEIVPLVMDDDLPIN